MTQNQQFILELLREGREYFKVVLPILLSGALGLHMPQPLWMNREKTPDEKK